MPYRVRWTTLALVVLACALAAPASGDSPSFASSFEPSDPQPTWVDTAERAAGRHRAGAARHPGQRHRHRRRHAGQRRERRRRRGEGEPRRRRRRTASGWSSSHRLGRARARRAGHGRPLRADLRQRRARARPAGLDAAGLRRRQTLDDARHADRARPSASASRPRPTTSPTGRPTSTTGSTSPATTAATIAQLAELQLSDGQANPPPAPVMRSLVGRGPRGGYTAKAGVGFTGLRALRYGGRHTAEGPRLLLQQGLRRRRGGHAARPSCRTGSTPTSSATTSATRAPTPRSTWPSPTAPT